MEVYLLPYKEISFSGILSSFYCVCEMYFSIMTATKTNDKTNQTEIQIFELQLSQTESHSLQKKWWPVNSIALGIIAILGKDEHQE